VSGTGFPEGIVNLTSHGRVWGWERQGMMSLCRRLGTRLLSPDFEGRGTRHSVVGRRHPVTSWVKVSIDKPVRRQEALRLL
jgi:hypothetical protein